MMLQLDFSEAKEEAVKEVNRRRRWTFGDESTDAVVLRSGRGTLYGNMALEYDMLQREMAQLQKEHLNYFKNLIKCEQVRPAPHSLLTDDSLTHTH